MEYQAWAIPTDLKNMRKFRMMLPDKCTNATGKMNAYLKTLTNGTG
ncbi:hypothetical protein D1AOALGA4SA_5333 [Olavius algarvensis Delta 1 endosymbiont]|nr:hypothetical protein D1AOALGA4SA_5333 [Olavius algarvensis Delta 1 endosymbiont]